MKLMNDLLLPCLYSCIGCFGFCFILNVRGRLMLLATLGGALGWGVFLLCAPLFPTDILRYLLGTVVVAAYGEIMARVCKVPATSFLLVGLLPFVPGGGIYHTMEYCINGDIDRFIATGIHTLGIAGALALGVLLVSSFVRLWSAARHLRRKARSGPVS